MMNFKDLLYCKRCGGMIDFRFCVTLLSAPPKYRFACKDCGDLRTYTEAEKKFVEEELLNGSGS